MAMAECDKLINGLAEVVVLLGSDSDTGIQATPSKTSGPILDLRSRLFEATFAPEILAALSHNVASFSFSNPKQDPNYPPKPTALVTQTPPPIAKPVIRSAPPGNQHVPSSNNVSRSESREGSSSPTRMPSIQNLIKRFSASFDSSVFNKDTNNNGEQTPQANGHARPVLRSAKSDVNRVKALGSSITRKSSFNRTDFMRKTKPEESSVEVKTKDLPLSAETLNSLVTFCFPDGAQVHAHKPACKVHYLLLTDLMGQRTYATCLSYSHAFIAQWKEDDEWSLINCPNGSKRISLDRDQLVCHVPQCLVLVSKYPYLNIMKDCLSNLLGQIEREGIHQTNRLLKEFTLQLTMTPVPPADKVAIEFILNESRMTLYPPMYPHMLHTDISFHRVFQHFKVTQILKVITCILTQQRIVFLSHSYALTTIVIQSFLYFIEPFQWKFTLVPILPENQLEFLMAPGTFIMGCHAKFKPQITQIEDLVVIDIEHGDIIVSKGMFIPAMPYHAVEIFQEAVEGINYNFDLWELEGATSFGYAETKKARHNFETDLHQIVLNACLELMVNLYRNILNFTKVEQRFFNKQKFLESIDPKDHTFYEQVLDTDLFSAFLKDRLKQKQDAWSTLEQQTRLGNKNNSMGLNCSQDLLDKRRSTTFDNFQPNSLSGSSSGSLNVTLLSLSDLTYFRLPTFSFQEHGEFYDNCQREFTNKLQGCRTPLEKAPYHYLIGMISSALGHRLQALQCLNSVLTNNQQLFPHSEASDIIESLSDKERRLLEEEMFYTSSPVWRKIGAEKKHEKPIVMALNKMPKIQMDEAAFSEMVQMLEIAVDHDSIHRLFVALTLGCTGCVSPELFEDFYRAWKETEMLCREVAPDCRLQQGECPLKISEVVKCSFGMGRIGLTQFRLFYRQEGSRQCKDIVRLRDIKYIEGVNQKSIFTQFNTTGIRIVSIDESTKFVMYMSEYRELWNDVIQEMWVASRLAEEHKDVTMIQQAAQNVLLVDAYVRSGVESEFVTQFFDPEEGAAILCSFTAKFRKSQSQIPRSTRDSLHITMNPNSGELSSATVECMLYTATGSTNKKICRLWCGMSNNKIKIFDAVTWQLLDDFIPTEQKVVCMISLGSDTYIWAASFDHIIYIINTQTMSCEWSLSEHSDMVSSLCKTPDDRYVFSCTLGGHIIKWEPATLKPLISLHVTAPSLKNMVFINSQLWCATQKEVLLLGDNQVARRLDYNQNGELAQIDCFCVLIDNKEVWVGCGRKGLILVYETETFTLVDSLSVTCSGISKMIALDDKIWIGSKEGLVFIFNTRTRKLIKSLVGHQDSVRSMCIVGGKLVATGGGSKDGRVVLWKADS